MKLFAPVALLSMAIGFFVPAANAEVDCVALAVAVKNAVIAKPAVILQTVEAQVQASPECACEVVKAAIEASKADVKLVAAIVETAATAAPEKMRIIAQCAVAVMPDSLASVQAVLAKLDPSSGHRHSDSKDAKDSKAPAVSDNPAGEWNPLNFPGQGPIGPNPGSPGGYPIVPPGLPPGTVPPSVNPPVQPPVVSNPNFPPT